MEYVILGLLIIKPMTIYDLNLSFKQGISLFYSASYGSLQRAVGKLLEKHLINIEEKIENGRNKKIYQIQPAGQTAFFEWMMMDISEKKLEVTALSKLFFLGLVASNDTKKLIIANIIKTIVKVQHELEEVDQNLENSRVDPTYNELFKYQIKTLKYGIASHRMAKGWFQHLLTEID